MLNTEFLHAGLPGGYFLHVRKTNSALGKATANVMQRLAGCKAHGVRYKERPWHWVVQRPTDMDSDGMPRGTWAYLQEMKKGRKFDIDPHSPCNLTNLHSMII